MLADEFPKDLDFGPTAVAIATQLNASHIWSPASGPVAIVVPVDFYLRSAPPVTTPVPKKGWDRLPTGEDLAIYYPQMAATMEQTGWALMRCVVASSGELTGCKVAAEAPEGWGFGKAALSLSKDFRVKPAAKLAGCTISIPLNFRLPNSGR